MKQHWKKLVIAVVALIVVVVAGSFIYAKFINKADEEFDSGDVKELLDATTTVAPEQPVATDPTATSTGADTTSAPEAPHGVAGAWVIAAGSAVGYRVGATLNGSDPTAPAPARTADTADAPRRSGRRHARGAAGTAAGL